MQNCEKSWNNLDEFLRCFTPETVIIVKTKETVVFRGKVSEMNEEILGRYWIVKGGVNCIDGTMHILVEDEDEVNRKLVDQNRITFSNIADSVIEDSKINERIKQSFDSMIKSAYWYVDYKKKISECSVEMLGQWNRERSISHVAFIMEVDSLAKEIESVTKGRVVLGDERKTLGAFAEYIIDHTESIKV